jgi:hypothetical protein
MSVLLVHTACIETPTGERIMQFTRNWFSLRYTGITNMDHFVQSEISFDLDYVNCKISASFLSQKGHHTGQKTTWVLCDPSGDGKQAEIKGSHGTSIAKLNYSTEGWWPCESPRRHKQILMILTRSLVITVYIMSYDIRVQPGFDDVLAIAMCCLWVRFSMSLRNICSPSDSLKAISSRVDCPLTLGLHTVDWLRGGGGRPFFRVEPKTSTKTAPIDLSKVKIVGVKYDKDGLPIPAKTHRYQRSRITA